MSDIFISYARANLEVAAKLIHILSEKGYRIWWDKDIISGHRFRQAIEEKIEAAPAIIVIWSEAACVSDFVLGEAVHAKQSNKLIATKLDHLDSSKLPIDFRSLHTISVCDLDGIEEALKNLNVTPHIKIIEPSYIAEVSDNQSFNSDLLQQLAEQGDSIAMHELAAMYHSGNKLQQNDSKAIYWYLEAVKNGHQKRDTVHSYASMYDEGRGAERNRERSSFWLYSSLAAGNNLSLKQMLNNSEAWSTAFRRELQLRLKSSNFYTGPIDGTFGPKTIKAIKELADKT